MSEPSWEQADPTFPDLEEDEPEAVITTRGGIQLPPMSGRAG